MNIFIFDNLDNEIDEIVINKPKTYQELLKFLSNKNKLYEIFIYDNNNKIIINNEEKYKIIKDILFIKEIDNLNKSIFSINYKKLSESRQEILDEKFNCNICSIIIKNEKPYLCYKCQKIFHEKCLKEWDNKCKLQTKVFECPAGCKNETPLEQWNKKLDYEDNKIDDANLLNKINEYKLNNKMNNNINVIKDKKIKKYENYINNTLIIFKNILNKLNIIHHTMKMKNNNKLNEIINNDKLDIENINDISNIINKELINIHENIKLFHNNEIKIKLNENIHNNNEIEIKLNEKDEYKNEIKLYYVKNIFNKNIFGKEFVKNNKDNIELLINNEKNKLVDQYDLNEGENVITLLIKNKLTNLSYMFYRCESLKDIKELEYLNVEGVKNF